MSATNPEPEMAPYHATGKWGPTSMGIDPQVGAGLAYITIPITWVIVPIIFFVAEKRNRFLRFHAAQALLLSIAPLVLALLYGLLVALGAGILAAINATIVVNTTTGAVTGSSAAVFGSMLVIGGIIYALLMLGWFALWIWGIVAGFTGEPARFPILGGMSEGMAGGPPVPEL